MRFILMIIGILLLFIDGPAEFPEIDRGNIKPNDQRLSQAIEKSKSGELTIASFNIRNLGTQQRGIKDFEALTDLLDETDIFILQEVGLGMFKGSGTDLSAQEKKRTTAIVAMFQAFLGEGWTVVSPPHPSGVNSGRETSLLAYREKGIGFDISAQWHGYEIISDGKRDMPIYLLKLTRGHEEKEIFLGSVHLTPEDPDRGAQMIKVADWLLRQNEKPAIVMGDFNWGYSMNSKIPAAKNYQGEDCIIQLHKEEKIFQLFFTLSYKGPGKDEKFRTNLGFRQGAFFYDQFLLTPVLAGKLADGGKLLDDCGIIAFEYQKYMKDSINKAQKRRQYGYDKYSKYLDKLLKANEKTESLKQAQKKAAQKMIDDVSKQGQNDGTWILSDHRVIWLQLKMW